jgi:chorismate synthase
MLRFLSGGESHGKAIVAILEGIPAGLPLRVEDVNRELSRRQKGYGSGKRMEIEKDSVAILSGVRWGKSLGSPITLVVENKDWKNWEKAMSVSADGADTSLHVTQPRPGHADLAGALKYNQKDVRNVLERASARETAGRVAAGAVCKRFLSEFAIDIFSYTVSIGRVRANPVPSSPKEMQKRAESSELRCPDSKATARMKKEIDKAKKAGDSLGGVFAVVATGVPPGLGSYIQWDMRMDGRLARAIMSIQAVKAVEIGLGFECAARFGSQVHDAISYDKRRGFYRKTNRAGGIEGGITNGEDIIIRAAMKPIATLTAPLKSVDIERKKAVKATVERSDICRVPSAGIIAEAVVALEIARAFREKFGGDSLEEVERNVKGYQNQLNAF